MVPDRKSAIAEPAHRPVGPHDSELDFEFRFSSPPHDLGHSLAIFGNNPMEEWLIILIAIALLSEVPSDSLIRRAQIKHALEIRRFDPKHVAYIFRQLPEPLFALAQRFLNALALSDVLPNANTGSVGKPEYGPRGVDHPAIADPNLEVRPFSVGLADEIEGLFAILGVRVVLFDNDVHVLALYLFERPSERSFPFLIHQPDPVIPVHETDHDGEMVEDSLQNLFLFPQLLLGLLTLADVLPDGNQGAIGKPHRSRGHVDKASVFDSNFEVRPLRRRVRHEG